MEIGNNTEIFNQQELDELRKKHSEIKKSVNRADRKEKRNQVKLIGLVIFLSTIIILALILFSWLLSRGGG